MKSKCISISNVNSDNINYGIFRLIIGELIFLVNILPYISFIINLKRLSLYCALPLHHERITRNDYFWFSKKTLFFSLKSQ